MSPTQALVVLFVVLPVVVAAVIIPLVAWRTSHWPTPVLTSEILASGAPASGRIRSVRSLGNILDVRPMVRFVVEVTAGEDGEPFELEVVQSIPRSLVSTFQAGDRVEMRITADRAAGAIVLGGDPRL